MLGFKGSYDKGAAFAVQWRGANVGGKISMAHMGLYKSNIKRAGDSLLAQNANPSVDAVRVALGNTGSKTTIHKYLKELEEEGSMFLCSPN